MASNSLGWIGLKLVQAMLRYLIWESLHDNLTIRLLQSPWVNKGYTTHKRFQQPYAFGNLKQFLELHPSILLDKALLSNFNPKLSFPFWNKTLCSLVLPMCVSLTVAPRRKFGVKAAKFIDTLIYPTKTSFWPWKWIPQKKSYLFKPSFFRFHVKLPRYKSEVDLSKLHWARPFLHLVELGDIGAYKGHPWFGALAERKAEYHVMVPQWSNKDTFPRKFDRLSDRWTSPFSTSFQCATEAKETTVF